MMGGVIKATSVSTFRKNLKLTLDNVYLNHETLIVTRPDDQNVVVIGEDQFNGMVREINNLNYLLKVKKADEQIKEGNYHEVDFNDL